MQMRWRTFYNRAKNLPDGDDKVILVKKAFELYRGGLFI